MVDVLIVPFNVIREADVVRAPSQGMCKGRATRIADADKPLLTLWPSDRSSRVDIL